LADRAGVRREVEAREVELTRSQRELRAHGAPVAQVGGRRRASAHRGEERRRQRGDGERRAGTSEEAASIEHAAPPARSSASEFGGDRDRKSTRLNFSNLGISYDVFCLKKEKDRGKHEYRI